MAARTWTSSEAEALVRIGHAIREARSQAKLSQEALADACEIDRSHMGKVERGERNLTMLSLLRISSALERHASEILRAGGL